VDLRLQPTPFPGADSDPMKSHKNEENPSFYDRQTFSIRKFYEKEKYYQKENIARIH
jgi:hypothetical protein